MARKSGARRIFAIAALAAAALFFAAGCATRDAASISGQEEDEKEGEKEAQEEDARAMLLSRQLEGKTWILSGILFDGAFIPMEPAHSSGNVLVFGRDGTFRTTAARLAMSGIWRLSAPEAGGDAEALASIAMARLSLEGERDDDPAAARFQEAYLSAFEKAAALDAYGNSFMLYDADGRHILSFILNNPDW